MLTRRTLLLSAAAASLAMLPFASFAAEAAAGEAALGQAALPPAGSWPVTFKDLAGRTVILTQEPQRIIVANYIQNFMLVGGRDALKRVVGMTQDHWESTRMGEYQVFTTAYPELKSIPSIGGFHDDILNSEKIIALKPDAMIINRTQFAANTQRIEVFERAGIRVIVTDYHAMKLENHVLSTRIIGRMLGRDTVAEELCRKAIDGLKDVDARVARASAGKKAPKVYMELGSKGVGNYGNTYNSTILWGAMLAARAPTAFQPTTASPTALLRVSTSSHRTRISLSSAARGGRAARATRCRWASRSSARPRKNVSKPLCTARSGKISRP